MEFIEFKKYCKYVQGPIISKVETCKKTCFECNKKNCPAEFREEKNILPDSRNCDKRKERHDFNSETIYSDCSPCANKPCSSIFGSDLCRYHYNPKTNTLGGTK